MNKTKKECYDLALELQQLQPWNYFESDSPIFIKMPDNTDVYAQILGSDKKIYGIAFFEGEEGLGDILDMMDGEDKTDADLTYQLLNTSFIALYYDSFEELINPVYIDCVEEEFKNKPGKIPYFIELEKGYVPFKPQIKTFRKIKEYLQVLKLIVLKVKAEGFDYDSNEIFSVYVDDDYKDGSIDSIDNLTLPFPQMSLRYMNITCDKKRLDALKKKKKTDDIFILDAFYSPFSIPLDEPGREGVPYFLNLVSENHGGIIDSKILEPTDNREKTAQNMILNAIKQYGIPTGIAVRRDDLEAYINPIVEELDIDLYVMEWDEIDELYEEISQELNSFKPE